MRNVHEQYPVDGRIDYVRATGNFVVSWNGANGRRQEMTWEPPHKTIAVVAADVAFDSTSGLYTYTYSFSNARGAAQKLATIYLEAASPLDVAAPDDAWYSRRLSQFLRGKFGVADGWAWSLVRGTEGIEPGGSASGFRLVSKAPPGVVRVLAAGRTPNLVATEEPPGELHDSINDAHYRLPFGYTIGPVTLDIAGSAAAQVRLLDADIETAARQGWLDAAAQSAVRGLLAPVNEAIAQRDEARIATAVARARRSLESATLPSLLSEARALIELRLRLIVTKTAGR